MVHGCFISVVAQLLTTHLPLERHAWGWSAFIWRWWDLVGRWWDRFGYDVRMADILVPTVIIRAESRALTRPSALLILCFEVLVDFSTIPLLGSIIDPVRRFVCRAHWHCWPGARCVWVRGVSGLDVGHLTHRLGLLGHNVRTVDVYVDAVVVVRLPVPSIPRLYPLPAPFVVVVSSSSTRLDVVGRSTISTWMPSAQMAWWEV
jgi:hypothetical protein